MPADELGSVVRRFERRVEEAVSPPVRLVKTIGDGAMLVSAEADPLVRTAPELVERSQADERGPLLRSGIAAGEAITRAGDWYGRPVNLASRLTAFAPPGSLVASKEVRDAAGEDFAWTPIGRRRFKGVRGEVEVYRVRERRAAAA